MAQALKDQWPEHELTKRDARQPQGARRDRTLRRAHGVFDEYSDSSCDEAPDLFPSASGSFETALNTMVATEEEILRDLEPNWEFADQDEEEAYYAAVDTGWSYSEMLAIFSAVTLKPAVSSMTSRGTAATSRTASSNGSRRRPHALQEALRRRHPFGVGTRRAPAVPVLARVDRVARALGNRLEVCQIRGRSRRCRCGRYFRNEISTRGRVYIVGKITQLGSAAILAEMIDHFLGMLAMRPPSVFLYLAWRRRKTQQKRRHCLPWVLALPTKEWAY